MTLNQQKKARSIVKNVGGTLVKKMLLMLGSNELIQLSNPISVILKRIFT